MKLLRRSALVASLLLAATTVASAQPAPAPTPGAPAPEPPEKRKARALLKEGVRLLNAGQPADALELFRDAYQTFPSPAILTNIALAESALGRHGDAANTFQLYLDAPERDPTKVAGVEADLAALDQKVGRLRVTLDVTEDAELRVDGLAWFKPSPSGLVRLDPGAHKVAARRGAETSPDVPFDVVAGGIAEISIQLIPPPEGPEPPRDPAPPEVPPALPDEPAIVRRTPRAPSRVGAQAQVLVEPTGAGAAGALAATFAATPRLDLIAGGIVGPSFGGFAAARFALTTGTLRPTLTGGVPVMVADGTHVGVRGAAGLSWAFSRRASVIADVAAEYYPSPGEFYEPFMVIPSLGLHGRL